MRSYKFRIYPSKAQDEKMRHHLWVSKELWNKLLEATMKLYDEEKKFPNRSEFHILAKNSGLYTQVARGVAYRLQDALRAKIRAKKAGKKWGFPRFKNFDRMKSLNYPQLGFWLKDKLKVSPFGEISIKQHREIKGKIKTLSLKREASGKWFAIFCVEEEPSTPRKNTGEQVGIDLGLKTFAAFSNGRLIANPRHLKKHESELADLQRRLSKKKKGSRNRWKAKIKVGKLQEKVANTRKDFLHKLTTGLVNDYSFIALEKLASQEMAQERFGKQINDAGWGMFANMVRYKAEGAGCEVVFVDPKNTTQECSNCHQIVPKDLTVRTHDCPYCGLRINRDLNAARNILQRAVLDKATAGHAGSNACGDGPIGPSLKQEAPTS